MITSRWEDTTQRGWALSQEASCRVAAGGVVDASWLREAAVWLAEVSPAWEEMTGTVPEERSYRLLASSLELEAWLICWPQGGRLQLHDHGGASGALQVVSGTLEERRVLGRRELSPVRQLPVGSGVEFGPRYIHDVVNTRAQAATSVHVYSAAERAMTFYRIDGTRIVPIATTPGDAAPMTGSVIEAEIQAERAQVA